MDSVITIGQRNTFAEYMILDGADNRPPMTKKYVELSATEKTQADCDMKAINIILQGLPSDIHLLANHYRVAINIILQGLPSDIHSLANHHRVSKDLWKRVQLLMQGTSLTKQESRHLSFPIYQQSAKKFINPKQQATIHDGQIRPMLYDGNVIAKETNVISIADSEETLMLEEESRSKMISIAYFDQLISQDVVNIVVNSSVDVNTSVKVNSSVVMSDSVNYVEMCNKCLELEAELIKQHNMVEKYEYNRLSKRVFELAQHCISLEIAMQLNKGIFQKNNTSINQTEPLFNKLFELNNLKAKLQAKDTTIKKLKANIKRLNKTSTTNSVKKDIDEIETINIELEQWLTKLIAKNEHLKQT
nr:hypothetical protein [Tanacetum cinerariifolium]